MAVAEFVYATWALLYPELADTVDEAQATAFFAQAGLYCNNTDGSPVCDVSQRQQLLYMLTAHLAALSGAGGRDPGLVGRVAAATEGTVSIRLDAGAMSNTEAWYAQTTYGFNYWAATMGYRTAQYVPGYPQYAGSVPGYGYGRFPWPV